MTASGATADRPVATLALDVDGVLLDPDRGGDGNWSNELSARFGITRQQLHERFFATAFDDVLNGRRPIESALADSLDTMGSDVGVEEVLACWFDADYVVFDDAVAFARQTQERGVRVVLATNQEHRRAAYLRRRLGAAVELSDVIYSADLGCVKHEPVFFELASQRLGLGPERRSSVVFVDDVERNVEVARGAGWRAVHAAPGATWISEADELLDALLAHRRQP